MADVLRGTEADVAQQTEAVLDGVSRIFDSVVNIVNNTNGTIPEQVIKTLYQLTVAITAEHLMLLAHVLYKE